MPYFSPSLTDQPFAQIATRLNADIAAAEPHLRALSETQASTPRAPGKWSPKQILGHLIDSAANNHQRFVRGQSDSALRVLDYAQEHWVTSQHYAERPWRDLVDFWCSYNRHLAHVLAAIPESHRETPCTIGDDPPVSLSYVALDYVGHVQHHLGQIFEEAAP